MEPSPTPTADAVQAWLKAQQPPAATGETERLPPPQPQAAPTPSMLPMLLVVCFIAGLLVRDNPALIIGGVGLIVAIAWKLER
jgi:hypothetical protein